MAYSTQYDIKVRVLARETGEPLVGANVTLKNTLWGASSDTAGMAIIPDIPPGKYELKITYIGYQPTEKTVTVPLQQILVIHLAEKSEEFEEIIVTTTRSSRTIRDVPTRIEVISAEELDEKAAMNSANVAMLLRETTGIQVQQTSPNSISASIRIQGLDGRYTQILKDGFPLFGGFSGGLSIMQIPPLDLRQVEVIKGSNSTLYGGGAIAGLLNLLSKVPGREPELSIMFNQTSAHGSTVNGFYARKLSQLGFTLYAALNRQQPYDAEKDNFSNIPRTRSISLNPTFFYDFNPTTELRLAVNSIVEKRLGGDMSVIAGKPDGVHVFSETNSTSRYSYQLSLQKTYSPTRQLSFKNSIYTFTRTIKVPDYEFRGYQIGSFSEITYSLHQKQAEWIFGGNLFTDKFREESENQSPRRDYEDLTAGLFVQNSWHLKSYLAFETGLRTDYNRDFGLFVLPRVSIQVNLAENLTSRFGGGLGYKIPTIFTEEAESRLFQNILPIDRQSLTAETSVGLNCDLNYRTIVRDDFGLTVNQLFFYTQLSNSLILNEYDIMNNFRFTNSITPITSSGIETNVKLSYQEFSLFLNHTYIKAQLTQAGQSRQKPLTPRHNVGLALMFEADGKWRIGFEAYYIGPQFTTEAVQKSEYYMAGLMAMREFKKLSIFVNFENFTDARQSKFETVVFPPFNQPRFAEIWAPMDGFVANGGFKVNLW